VAGRIMEESIAEVRQATDIVALIGEYVTLRPAGGTRMKGLCPFHQEKTPSFTVNAHTGAWHCFGCDSHGDVIDFLMKQDALTFIEAVERLAGRAGIELRYQGRSAGDRGSLGRRSRLVAAHAEAVAFYHRLLVDAPEGRAARAYLSSRGYDRAVAGRFQLGWAPSDRWDALTEHLRGKGFRPEELLEAGLARTGSRGLRDAFHARVLFPIFDVAGDPVAFGGRVIEEGNGDGRTPKYVNTAETPAWHKGRTLYGLNWAKVPVVQAGFALVVEGYTDVLACHLAGITQAVAT
jgi:DNA primase